jgi:hypothetical protein
MKWYEKITEELINDFRRYAFGIIQKCCGPAKIKMNKERMNRLVMSSQCRGGVSTLDELLALVEKEKDENINKEFILGNIHIMRMNIWNEAVLYSDSTLKKIGIETAMQSNPKLEELISADKLRYSKGY